MAPNVIRVAEWSTTEVSLPIEIRKAIAGCVEEWKQDNCLNAAPLAFSGSAGTCLTTTHYVGIVEIEGYVIEIYPKLDKALISNNSKIDNNLQQTVMAALAWMLEVTNHDNVFDTETSGLETEPTDFLDLWATLLAKNLLKELCLGLARTYCPLEDITSTIRGRILFQPHLRYNFNRSDRVYCGWDEFTENHALNQILKCACNFLAARVQRPETIRYLLDCLAIFDEVESIDAASALKLADRITWDRSKERFKLPFNLAVRLLQSIGHQTLHAYHPSYVFLLDMNRLFEDYVGVILERAYGVPVYKQKSIGTLYKAPYKIAQKPDFLWTIPSGEMIIADSKYKPFFDWNSLEYSIGSASGFIDINDIRQLICYGMLAKREPSSVKLQLIYPYVGKAPLPTPINYTTFPDISLSAIPIRVAKCNNIGELIHIDPRKLAH